jgi:hypothetical protein
VLVDVDAENLTLFVDADDAVGRPVLCSYKDGFARDSVHVDAGTRYSRSYRWMKPYFVTR